MNDFQKYLVEEFAEDYSEGHLTRRQALKLIASVTGSLVVANSILAACAPPPDEVTPTTPANTPSPEIPVTAATDTQATPDAAVTDTPGAAETLPVETPQATVLTTQDTLPTAGAGPVTVPPEDPDLAEAGFITFPGGDGEQVQAYLSRPVGEGPFPVVLLCHENRGLTEHIQDVGRRLAKAGYVSLAVDLLSRSGGTQSLGSDEVPGILGNTPPEQFVEDFLSGWRYLQEQNYADTERTGMTGFCFGGGVTWRVAVAMPELRAAVPYYGPHPPVEDVPQIQAAVLAIYGERDNRINAGIPEIEKAMQANGKTYVKMIYPNADHAFHNDTGPRYNPEAAQDAWQRTLNWFAEYLA